MLNEFRICLGIVLALYCLALLDSLIWLFLCALNWDRYPLIHIPIAVLNEQDAQLLFSLKYYVDIVR